MNKEFFRYHNSTLENKTTFLEVGELLKTSNTIVVFDFDHTLFNTGEFHIKSFQDTLHALGRSLIITPDLGARLRGKSDEEILEILLDASGGVDSGLLSKAVQERENVLRQLLELKEDLSFYFMPGIPDAIRTLREHNKNAGIASSSPDVFIYEFTKRTYIDGKSIDDVFVKEGIVGGTTTRLIRKALSSGDNIPFINKPNPFSIIYAASKIKGEQESPILYIGDGRIDALSVHRRQNMVGLIVNAGEQDALSSEFGSLGNIVVVGSMQEVLSAK